MTTRGQHEALIVKAEIHQISGCELLAFAATLSGVFTTKGVYRATVVVIL